MASPCEEEKCPLSSADILTDNDGDDSDNDNDDDDAIGDGDDVQVNGEESDSPVWNHLYSASTDLGLKGVGPQDWMEVLLLTMTMMLTRTRMMRLVLDPNRDQRGRARRLNGGPLSRCICIG